MTVIMDCFMKNKLWFLLTGCYGQTVILLIIAQNLPGQIVLFQTFWCEFVARFE